jgi:arylsulfatase A-like enzyme
MPARCILLSLDGLSPTYVTPEIMPRLHALGMQGGMAPDGGRCDMPAVTYVCHASLITGTYPAAHGLTSNLAAAPRPGVVPGWAGDARVRTPTLFAALREAGLVSAAICGDQHLVRTMGTQDASIAWPPNGVLPRGTETCSSGYATKAAIGPHLLAAVADPELDFVFGHLNETDTWGHLLGPDHPSTLHAYGAADTIVAEVADLLAPSWDKTVLTVLSDHGMELARDGAPVDLMADSGLTALWSDVVSDGGVTLARLRDGVTDQDLDAALAGRADITGWQPLRPGVILVAGASGTRFATGPAKQVRGVHGGPGTTRTVAVVAGGHPAVARIAQAITTAPPHLVDWAPTVTALLGVPFGAAEGCDLAGFRVLAPGRVDPSPRT